MAFLFQEVTRDQRDQVEYEQGRGFLRTQKHVNKFLTEVLEPARRVDVEENGLCSITFDQQTNEIRVLGFGAELIARPTYICENKDWVASILFHKITRSVVGDPKSEAVYEVQIDKQGSLTCGAGAEHYDLYGAADDDSWFIRKRILLDLLVVIQSGPPPKAE